MNIIYSKTSSDGNCTIIESEKGSMIIVDCGLKLDIVNKAIGYKIQQADTILVTHQHSDHIGYLKDFCKLGIEIYLNEETMAVCGDNKSTRAYKYLFNPMKIYEKVVDDKKEYFYNPFVLEDFVILPFPLVHTSHIKDENGYQVEITCECTGFLIAEKSTKEKLLWITDTMYVHNKFNAVDYICIECNYFEVDNYVEEMEFIKNKQVEKRRLKSHMSFETALNFVNNQDLSKCKQIRLLHLSSSLDDSQRKGIARKFRNELKKDIEVIA